MKYVGIAIIMALLTGCGQIDRGLAKLTGGGSKTCIDGVMYLQFTSGATVMYNTDGSIKLCK